MPKAFFRDIRSGKRRAAITDLASITRREVEQTLDQRVKPALVKSHERVVEDWKTDVKFRARKVLTANRITVYVFPYGENKEIWYYVDQGTEPHQMPAVAGKLMVFRAGGTYVPKTMAKPARTVSGGGYVTGGTKVVTTKRKAFTHPGSEGRNFTGQIAEDIKPAFKRDVENAFRRAARKVQE